MRSITEPFVSGMDEVSHQKESFRVHQKLTVLMFAPTLPEYQDSLPLFLPNVSERNLELIQYPYF